MFLVLVFVFITILSVVIITRPLTTLLHELGHAIPAILITKAPVTIYIGSYGDRQKSINISIGYLKVWIHKNPIFWNHGLCVPSRSASYINRIIYILLGPFTSLVVALLLCYLTFTFDLHGVTKVVLVILLGSTIYDLYINLKPNSSPIQLYDGTITYNDGYLIKQLLKYGSIEKDIERANNFYKSEQYQQAGELYKMVIRRLSSDNKEIYIYAIDAFIRARELSESANLLDEFPTGLKLSSEDYSFLGYTCSQLNRHGAALEFYQESLRLDSDDVSTTCNMAYTLIFTGQPEEAIAIFDALIKKGQQVAYSYSNRGLAKINCNDKQGGLADIKYSISIDAQHPFGYRNLGIYYLEIGEYELAKENFERAKNLNSTTHAIDELIAKANRNI